MKTFMQQPFRIMKHKDVLIMSAVVSLFVVALCFCIIAFTNHETYAYSAAQINSKLYTTNSGGANPTDTSANTAVGWDRSCWSAMHSNRANGQSPRNAINNGGAYQTASWISASGNGSQKTITVPYGTKTINLQINSVTFLCSSLVQADGAGADYAVSNYRVVSQSNYPNDRSPNPVGGNTNWPAYTAGQFRIDRITASDGGALTTPSRSILAVGRGSTTRYWFAAPSTFKYTSPSASGITSDQTITITAKTRPMNQYYNGRPTCISPSGAGGYSSGRNWNFGACTQSTSNFTVRIVVAPYDHVYGSWVEYGIFAVGSIKGTGSGSAFAGSAGATAGIYCDYSKLSFVNATTSNPATSCNASGSAAGGYSTGRNIPNVAGNFPVVTSGANQTPTFDNNAARPQGLYTSANNLTIGNPATPKTIAKGQWAIINAPNANVTIAGDILYDGASLQSVADIPQLLIIAKNIYINPNVKQVDAWLIAKGTPTGEGVLDTCHVSNSYATQLTTTVCLDRLTVNGPVMAQHLWLRRTAGSGADDASGDPAEVFNLRPDAYLWGFARASTTGRIQTVYSNELPPRF